MYNEERKLEFISSYTNNESTEKFIRWIFTQFEPYEVDSGTDLAQYSADDIERVLGDRYGGVRQKELRITVHMIMEYIKWCAQRGYDTSDGALDINVDQISANNMRSSMVSSPTHLRCILDQHFRTPEAETVDVTYRAFFWLAFMGISDKEAVTITSDNIDLNNMVINFNGHRYEIYIDSVGDLQKACSLTDFMYEHANYTVRRSRSEGDILLRGVRSPQVDLKTIRPIITKRMSVNILTGENSRCDLSHKRIYMSGVFYRAYKRERMGLPVDFSEDVALEIERKERTKKYSTSEIRTMNFISNSMCKAYLEDYKLWKYAFSKQ